MTVTRIQSTNIPLNENVSIINTNITENSSAVSADQFMQTSNSQNQTFINKNPASLFSENATAFLTTQQPSAIETAWVSQSVAWRIDNLQRRMRQLINDEGQLDFEVNDFEHRLNRLERNQKHNLSYIPGQQDPDIELAHHRPHPHYPPHPRPRPVPPAPPLYEEHQLSILEAEMRNRGIDFVRLERDFERVDARLIRQEHGFPGSGFQAGPNLVHDYPVHGLELRLNQLERNMQQLEWRSHTLRQLSNRFDERLRRLEFRNLS